MKFLDLFEKDFYQKMISPAGNNPVRNRADSLSKVFEILDEKKDKNFFIVETGCMRADHGQLAFGDDGASTFIFDKFINFYDGEVVSVDINANNVEHARSMVSGRTSVYCSDSVEFLWSIPEKKKIDFLYLDSYDFEPNNPIPSQKHHLKELCAVMKNLRKGSIICVDDHLNTPNFDQYRATLAQGGKATFVEDFMNNIGAECLYDGYQIIWRL